MMNYDSKKLVSENLEDKKNLIVEDKIETLFTPRTSNEVISETTLKQIFKEVWGSRQSLISEQWARGTDQVGYWKVLFDNLKVAGVPVKWQVPNDPVKSTFMYWGPWVINKDINKNGGWPVTFTSADKKLWLFKFPGGKYAGQPVNNINLESKFINTTFNLAQWGKVDGAKGGTSLAGLIKSKPKSTTAAAACKTVDGKPIPANQIPAVAAKIYKELAYAFDGMGTYETEAVAAYDKITCKAILDAVNAKVAARGMQGIKNVGDWAKSEMSDYDYDQYRKIWTKLQKLGYKAPPVNQTMRVAGIAGEVTGVNALEKGAEGIQQLFSDPVAGFKKIIDAVRNFLGGIVGGVITTILDFTGIGKVVTTIGWGIILLGDIIISGIDKIRWAEIFFDLISIATTGVIAATAGKVLKPFFNSGSSLMTLVNKLSKYSWFKSLANFIQSAAAKITGLVGKAITWITSTSWWKKLAGSAVGKLINGAMTKLNGFLDTITKSLASSAGSKATTTQAKQELVKQGQKKIKDIATKDFAKDMAYDTSASYAGDVGGERLKAGVEVLKHGSALKGDVTNLGTQTQDITKNVANVEKKLAKTTGLAVKDTTKTGKSAYGVVAPGEEEPENKVAQTKTVNTPVPGKA